jgi:phage FluMu protein Com
MDGGMTAIINKHGEKKRKTKMERIKKRYAISAEANTSGAFATFFCPDCEHVNKFKKNSENATTLKVRFHVSTCHQLTLHSASVILATNSQSIIFRIL